MTSYPRLEAFVPSGYAGSEQTSSESLPYGKIRTEVRLSLINSAPQRFIFSLPRFPASPLPRRYI